MRLCVCVASLTAGLGAETTLSFANPRFAAHVVSHDPPVVISGVERGAVFTAEGSVTYRVSDPALIVRGSALKEGLDLAVSKDGELWNPIGTLAGHEMIDVDLRPYGKVQFVRFTAKRGVLHHPTCPEQQGAFTSPVFDIPAALRKAVSVSWGAGATRGTPVVGEPDLYGTPESVRSEVLPGGNLAGGTYGYAILTTFDEGQEQRDALQESASVGNGGLVRITWAELVGGVERLAKEARKGKEELTGTLSLGADEEEKDEGDDDEPIEELDDPDLEEEKPKGEPEYYYEIYRLDPGEELFRLVHRLPKGELMAWTDRGDVEPGAALSPKTELKPVTRRKHAKPYTLKPELEAHFGALPPGRYTYRVAAVLPEGEMPPAARMVVETTNLTNEIFVDWEEVRNALQYKVYRSARNDTEGPAKLLAQLPAPLTEFTDHGTIEPGQGVVAGMQYRCAAGKDTVGATEWRPVPGSGEVDLTGQSSVQFRATASSSPAGYTPAFAGVTLCNRGERPHRPRRILDLAFRHPNQHPWGGQRPILGGQTIPPQRPSTRNQITFAEKSRINCISIASRAGLFCIRDYDVQYFSDSDNDWRPLYAVRNNSHLIKLCHFEPVETRAIRFVTFGEPLFGAYALNMGVGTYRAGFTPIAATRLTLNGQRLTDVSTPSYYDLWKPIRLPRGDNALKLKVRDVVGADVSLSIRALKLVENGEPVTMTEKKGISVEAGQEAEASLSFGAEDISGWISFDLIEEATKKKLYTFQYLARMAPPLSLRLRRPDYRQTIFESQPDKTVEGEVSLGSSAKHLKGCRVVVSAVRQRSSRVFFREEKGTIEQPRWSVQFDGNSLPYGSYHLTAELLGTDGRSIAKLEKPFHRCAPSPYGECWIGRRNLLFKDGKPIIALKMLGMGRGHFDPRIRDQAAATGFNVLDAASEEARARGVCAVDRLKLPRNRAGDGWYQRRFEVMNTTDPTLLTRLAGTQVNSALLAYNYGDELDVKAEQKKDISAYFPGYHIYKRVDPYHPVDTLLFDSNGFLGGLGRTCDIFTVEPYLYAMYSDTRREAAARMKKIVIWSHAAALYANRPGLDSRRALWAYPMNWDPRVWNGERDNRIPSVMENRCLLFFLLNDGFSGFLFYNYCTSYFHLKLNPLFWEAHRATVQEINFLMPFLVDEKLEGAQFEPDTASLSLGLFKHGQDYALIALNLDAYPVRARIQLPDSVESESMNVLSEGRSVRLKDGTLDDHFDGFGVHLYTTLSDLPDLPMAKILKDKRFLRGPHHDVQPGNLASETQGATAKASHTIWWYNSAIFAIDGDRETCWNTSAWAAWGKKSGDWLEVTLLKPQKISRVVVRSWKPKYFNDFDDTDNLASDFDVQVWQEDWQTVKEIRGNQSEVVEIPFAPVTTQKIRIVMKKGLCVSEVEAYQ